MTAIPYVLLALGFGLIYYIGYTVGYYRAAYLGEKLRRSDFEVMSGFVRPTAARVRETREPEEVAVERAMELQRAAEEETEVIAERMAKEFVSMGHSREAAEAEARRLVTQSLGYQPVDIA